MKGYWTHFAKRGLPGSFGTAFWPLFNTVTQEMKSLGATRAADRD
jgi:hypothetical protein